jgi:hypothetical protein
MTEAALALEVAVAACYVTDDPIIVAGGNSGGNVI